jgi:pimeloyl-ACP methyl ester carboxylesterase
MHAVRRPLLAPLAPAAAGLAFAGCALAGAPADAAVRFRPCSDADGSALCARVAVSLDRSGGLPGTLRLFVQRVPARPRRSNVLVVLVGGPGQAATPLRASIRAVLAPALRRRELVVFDQRGTGRSGALLCPTVERPIVPNPAAAAAACAARLGPARAHYTTRDSIADVEAVRHALGVERLSLLGISYGAKVALGYATAFPGRVERLVLDSPVEATGPDAFARSSFAAVPRVLGDLCRARRCRGITTDPVADLAALSSRLRPAPLRGTVVGSRGQRRRAALRNSDLLGMLFTSDVDPTLLPSLPGAVRSALRGDGAPILRLARSAAGAEAPEPPQAFSSGLLVTTLCEELMFPWTRTAATEQRRAELGAAADAIGDAPFAPFDRAAAIAISIMPACVAWPSAPTPPAYPVAPAPAAPTLLLSGTSDLRTPREDALAVAAALPDARVLSAVGVGHSVLSSNSSGCPERAVGVFFAGRAVRRACQRDRLFDIPPDPVAPLSLREVPTVAGLGGQRGRTVSAVLLTLGDLGTSLLSSLPDAVLEIVERGTASAGGLRGGYAILGSEGIELHRLVYVPGVVVAGRVRFGGGRLGFGARFRVSGRAALHGTVRVSASGAISGRLGGRPFRLRVPGGALAGASTARGAVAALARLRRLSTQKRDGRPRSGRPPRQG